MCLFMNHILCRLLLAKHQIPQVTQPLYSPDLAPCNFWLFPKLKSPLKGKRFQTLSEIQENLTGQLMVIGRIVWDPKVPTLKGTEVSLSYVQCFLYLGSSSIKVSIFHSRWLGTFWEGLVYLRNAPGHRLQTQVDGVHILPLPLLGPVNRGELTSLCVSVPWCQLHS